MPFKIITKKYRTSESGESRNLTPNLPKFDLKDHENQCGNFALKTFLLDRFLHL